MRDLLTDDSGLSLIEIVLAVALVGVVLSIASSFLVSAQNTVVREEKRSAANDEARIAIEQLDREVRSANFILTLDPHTLLIQTQSNFTTHNTTRCVQWTVDGNELQRREWPAGQPAAASGWSTIAEGVANRTTGQATFTLPNTVGNRVSTGGRAVQTVFLVNAGDNDHPDATLGLRQTLMGRNISAGASTGTWPPPLGSEHKPCDVLA